MTLPMGSFSITPLSLGTFALDGGAMFGVVPKALWNKLTPADERNRITLEARAFLIRAGDRTILVECGIGDALSPRERERYDVRGDASTLDAALATQGLTTEAITDVIPTHLHFDHAGGLARRSSDGSWAPTFPAAALHVTEAQAAWALAPTKRDAKSFTSTTTMALEDEERLVVHEGAFQLMDGISVVLTHGHTPGHMVVAVQDGHDKLLLVGDTVPTQHHVALPFIMAYDLRPLATLTEKQKLLAKAADEGWILGLTHDPRAPFVRIARRGDDFNATPYQEEHAGGQQV